jgi:hypothetical protein
MTGIMTGGVEALSCCVELVLHQVVED